MSKYVIQQSTHPNKWVLTDTENGVVIVFEDGRFNETQKVTMLEDAPPHSPTDLAQIMRKLGEWVVRHHSSKCFNSPYGIEYSEDNSKLFLYRRKSPCWRLEIEENFDKNRLASSLKKAAEWLTKK